MESQNNVMFAADAIKIRGEFIEVRPYAWGRTVKAAKPLSAVIKAGAGNAKYINDILYNLNHQNKEVFAHQLAVILDDIMDQAGDELIELIRLSVNKSPKWVRSLTLQEFFDVVVMVYKINEPFFKSLFVKKTEEKSKDGITAEQAATFLVEYGHLYDDVLDKYTLDQVVMFLQNIIAREQYKKADNAESVMLGIGGSFASKPDKVTKLLQEMKGGVHHGK